MHPWKVNLLELLQNIIRFALWVALILNVGMASVFAVWFTFKFLRSLTGWADRVLFGQPW